MYESYAWPGAYSFRTEIKMLVRRFKERLDDLIKKIEKKI